MISPRPHFPPCFQHGSGLRVFNHFSVLLFHTLPAPSPAPRPFARPHRHRHSICIAFARGSHFNAAAPASVAVISAACCFLFSISTWDRIWGCAPLDFEHPAQQLPPNSTTRTLHFSLSLTPTFNRPTPRNTLRMPWTPLALLTRMMPPSSRTQPGRACARTPARLAGSRLPKLFFHIAQALVVACSRCCCRYKASRDGLVAASATITKSLYE